MKLLIDYMHRKDLLQFTKPTHLRKFKFKI
jgi:hypothetical protein